MTHLLVHPDYRRQGIGSELMRRLLSGTEEFENVVTTALTAEARSFYEAIGFSEMKASATIEPHAMQRFKRPV